MPSNQEAASQVVCIDYPGGSGWVYGALTLGSF